MQQLFLAGLSISFSSVPGHTLLPASLLGSWEGTPPWRSPHQASLLPQYITQSRLLLSGIGWWEGTPPGGRALQAPLSSSPAPPILTVQAGLTHGLVGPAGLGHALPHVAGFAAFATVGVQACGTHLLGTSEGHLGGGRSEDQTGKRKAGVFQGGGDQTAPS